MELRHNGTRRDSSTQIVDGQVTTSAIDIYRVFFFLWFQSGGCKTAILMSFKQFLYFLHSKLWAHFHFGTFDP